ncbi:hypothetical protein JAAARDRAFT_413634 [Jaapia argillacea MUCL 33604]|uniref:AB hydrolase-1 domain-containing protein n=1 Tax=Jaapia argillacea MUCL 33604 TaxID=933084 RepID=A0A067PS93_9AGAM|nr:hypothetical protein JAAARDRAFT_413634 [Jaapia argillacea MUCL 33604]
MWNSCNIWLSAVILCCLMILCLRRLWHQLQSSASSIRLFHCPTSARLGGVQGTHQTTGDDFTLIDLVKREVPALCERTGSFRQPWWLPCGNAQTMYCSLGDFSKTDPITYQRKFLHVPDRGILAIDITPPLTVRPATDGEPILLVLHGLTGGSHESYVRAALSVLTSSQTPASLPFRAVVLNSRGCNGSPVTTPKLYHAGTTDDIRHTILWICHTFPTSPIFGLGFSIGANALVKYVGEEGVNCPLSGIVSLANVWDFVRGSRHIENGSWMNRYVYDYVLGGALYSLLNIHRHIFLASGPEFRNPLSHLEELVGRKRFVRLREYDDLVTSPLYGFKDASHYYASISSDQFVDRVVIPCLAINSADDPIVGSHNLPLSQVSRSPWVIMALTGGGGHMGWFECVANGFGLRRWYVAPVQQFLTALMKHDVIARPRPKIRSGEKGAFFEDGRPDIGFTEIDCALFASGMGDSKLFSGWSLDILRKWFLGNGHTCP